ncbi:MAG: DUF433 domain-containing protein [Nitrososphaerota archaeon]|jgi:uncharacterized protein (DUF433 family)|nr:DUF433 domain-containing protein [Nitrososphaerota archaeon]MDG6923319.1 DUF433 domain-containing protein [Nitrososphaerota archaeon]
MDKSDNDLISVDPDVCDGKPVVKGTRVPVEYILHLARSGYSTTRISDEFDLSEELVKKVIKTVEKTPSIKFA